MEAIGDHTTQHCKMAWKLLTLAGIKLLGIGQMPRKPNILGRQLRTKITLGLAIGLGFSVSYLSEILQLLPQSEFSTASVIMAGHTEKQAALSMSGIHLVDWGNQILAAET